MIVNMNEHKHKKWDLVHLIFYHKLNYVILVALSFTIVIGVLVTQIEQSAKFSNITNYHDGIWWAFATVASVGYGDYVPVTYMGRTLAVVLMFVGISLFSIITANIASFFVEEDEEKEFDLIAEKIDRLEKKIDSLQTLLDK